MRFHHPGYLRVLREVTRAHGMLLIFDEIATGFGRTGEMFAAEHAGVTPDVHVRRQGADRRLPDPGGGAVHPGGGPGHLGRPAVLAHGPTFMGNPLACAVANASIGLLRAGDWAGRGRAGSAPACAPAWSRCGARPGVADVRVLGAIGVVQLDHEVDLAAATAAAVAPGRVAAPVPRSDLHDAAVRHRRRRPGPDRDRDGGGGGGRLSRPGHRVDGLPGRAGRPDEKRGALRWRASVPGCTGRWPSVARCVSGIDPHPGLLAQLGPARTTSTGLDRFSRTVVEALGDRVAVVKPQSAFFERFGSRGVAILESTIRQLRDAGSLVLLDVKRGDIGSTVARVRRRVPRSIQPDVCRRGHREPLPGGRFAGADVRRGRRARRRRVRAGPHLQPGGRGRAAGRTARRAHRRADRSSTRFPSSTGVRSRSAASVWWSARPSATPVTTSPGWAVRCSLRGSARRAAGAADLRTVFGSSLAAVLPSYSREVLGAGPDVGRAAGRGGPRVWSTVGPS